MATAPPPSASGTALHRESGCGRRAAPTHPEAGPSREAQAGPPLEPRWSQSRRLPQPLESDCSLPLSLRQQRVLPYPLAEFAFGALLRPLLGVSAEARLDRLHEDDRVVSWMAENLRNGSRPFVLRRNPIDRAIKVSGGFKQNGALGECYRRFLREVVMPAVDPDGEGIYYQREPNLRCHLPGTGSLLTGKHRDADFYHQPNEVNVWLPVTLAFGTNSVWSESAPGRGDHAPFEAEPGGAVLFWAAQCEHYTVPNETGATRLSFDFRVVPRRLYRERYPGSHTRQGSGRFELGGFFCIMEAASAEDAAAARPAVRVGDG